MRAKPQNFLRLEPLECQLFSSIAMSTYPNMLEPLLGPTFPQILSELEENFPPSTPHPNEEINTIMYKAGQRSVVEWLKERLEAS